MILETEKRAYDGLAKAIVDQDPGVFSCVLLGDPQGSVLSRSAKPEFQQSLDLPKNTEGMAGRWAILAFTAMKRLDSARSKTKFITIGREDHKALIFPVNFHGTDLMLIMSIGLRQPSNELYEKITNLVARQSLAV